MRKIMSLFAAPAILAFLTTHALSEEGPKGWLLRGVSTNDYIIGIDSHTFHSGARSGYIEYTTHPMIIRHGFGTLMQACKAEQYSGKRIRVSAYLKAQGVKRGAQLWLRLDENSNSPTMNFSQPILGDTEWTRVECVVDVPVDARDIAFGVTLDGRGKVWIDTVQFEVLSESIPDSDRQRDRLVPRDSPLYPDSPVNLGFEE